MKSKGLRLCFVGSQCCVPRFFERPEIVFQFRELFEPKVKDRLGARESAVRDPREQTLQKWRVQNRKELRTLNFLATAAGGSAAELIRGRCLIFCFKLSSSQRLH